MCVQFQKILAQMGKICLPNAMPPASITLPNLTHGLPFDSLSHILSHDAWVLAQNQDQYTSSPDSLLADLF